jgi:hypothetical protein
MVITAVFLSGTCLILEDANGETVQDIGPALGLNVTADTGIMLGDIVSKCFNPGGNSSEAELAELLFVRGDGDADARASRVTLRQKLLSELKAEIDERFAIVTARLNLNLPSLASDPRTLALRNALRENPADKMIIPDYGRITASASFSSLLDVASAATVGFRSSAACDDHTVSAGISGSLAGQEFYGITRFLAELQALGDGTDSPVASPACARHVGCAGVVNESACNAGNALIDLKAELQGLNGHEPYQCNLFEGPSGGYCDPSNMAWAAGTSPPQYTGDCISAEGTMTVRARTCDLTSFTTYLAGFDDRVNIVFERLDSTTVRVQGLINTTLRQLLYQDLLDETSSLLDRTSCSTLATSYAQIVGAFCYQALHGWWRMAASCVGLAILQLWLVLPIYIVWRVCRDNMAMDSEAANTVRSIVAARKIRGEAPACDKTLCCDKTGFCSVCGQ